MRGKNKRNDLKSLSLVIRTKHFEDFEMLVFGMFPHPSARNIHIHFLDICVNGLL